MQKFRLLEFSTDMKTWQFAAAWTEEEAEANWKSLLEWLEAEQPFGIFRLVKEGYSDD